MLKRRTLWVALAILLLAAGVGASVVKKKTELPGFAAAAAPATLEFLPSDVMLVKPRDLRRTLDLSGSLRAVNQAAVKAKVAGEVRDVLVREGEAVTAGQVLVKMDASEYQARVDQARGALQAARGQLEIAAKARDNNQALLGKGFISRNAFDNAASQYDIARANVESAKGALDVAQKALADTIIRAPISGLVSSRTVQPGEKVSADNRLLDVVDLRQMEMEAAVPTTDIMNIALDQEVLVKIDGLQAALTGKVARINPSTQAGSRSIMVYVQIDNPKSMLRVGMFGQAQLTLAKKEGVLTVPQSAIQNDGASQYVYAIEDSVLVQRPVVTGMRGSDADGPAVEIVKGLTDSAQIVRNNLGTLRTGTAVRFAAAANAIGAPNPVAVPVKGKLAVQ
jgi:RND family efflux transporter MFP subunit